MQLGVEYSRSLLVETFLCCPCTTAMTTVVYASPWRALLFFLFCWIVPLSRIRLGGPVQYGWRTEGSGKGGGEKNVASDMPLEALIGSTRWAGPDPLWLPHSVRSLSFVRTGQPHNDVPFPQPSHEAKAVGSPFSHESTPLARSRLLTMVWDARRTV